MRACLSSARTCAASAASGVDGLDERLKRPQSLRESAGDRRAVSARTWWWSGLEGRRGPRRARCGRVRLGADDERTKSSGSAARQTGVGREERERSRERERDRFGPRNLAVDVSSRGRALGLRSSASAATEAACALVHEAASAASTRRRATFRATAPDRSRRRGPLFSSIASTMHGLDSPISRARAPAELPKWRDAFSRSRALQRLRDRCQDHCQNRPQADGKIRGAGAGPLAFVCRSSALRPRVSLFASRNGRPRSPALARDRGRDAADDGALPAAAPGQRGFHRRGAAERACVRLAPAPDARRVHARCQHRAATGPALRPRRRTGRWIKGHVPLRAARPF